MALPEEGRQDVLFPLSTEAITAVLTERGDRFLVEQNGSVAGRWGESVIYFDRVGSKQELLHIRTFPAHHFAADRRTELHEFCNGWNHDRLLPKAFVYDTDGELLVAGEITTDFEHGVAARQLATVIQTAISASAQLAEALDQLP